MLRTTLRILALMVALHPHGALAQTRTTGQIVGTVKDASGAVIPNVALILIDIGTGTTAETRSGSEGGLRVPQPAAGNLYHHRHRPGLSAGHPAEGRGPRPRDPLTSPCSSRSLGVTEQVQVEGRDAGGRDDVDDGREHRDATRRSRSCRWPAGTSSVSRCWCPARRRAPARATANTTVCRMRR